MADFYTSGKVEVPKEWPGVIEAYKLVRPFVKERIWDFVSIVGIGLILDILLQIVFKIIFRGHIIGTVVYYIAGIFVGAFLQASLITLYFAVLNSENMSLQEALNYGYSKLARMAGLLIVMYVVLAASLVLLIVPFFFVLPRVLLAPYFLIYKDLPVNKALAVSWHSTAAHAGKVYGIIGLALLIALLFFTIIGIPFAIYFGIINSGIFALLTLYILQPKKKTSKKD